MLKKINKKHIAAIIITTISMLIIIWLINIFTIFIRPLIQPYFFKTATIERLVNVRRMQHYLTIIDYIIIPEPSYSFARTSGIKNIYSRVGIGENVFEAILRNDFNVEYDFEKVNAILNSIHGKSLDFDYFQEYHILYYFDDLHMREYTGFFFRRQSLPTRRTQVFVILTIEEDIRGNEVHFLYVFNVNDSR